MKAYVIKFGSRYVQNTILMYDEAEEYGKLTTAKFFESRKKAEKDCGPGERVVKVEIKEIK